MLLLEAEGVFHVGEYKNNKYIIEGDIGIINLRTAKKIGKLKTKFSKMGVKIEANINKITIEKIKSAPSIKTKIKTKDKINIMNLDYENDDENELNRNNIEYEISKNQNHHEFNPNNMREIYEKIVCCWLVGLPLSYNFMTWLLLDEIYIPFRYPIGIVFDE